MVKFNPSEENLTESGNETDDGPKEGSYRKFTRLFNDDDVACQDGDAKVFVVEQKRSAILDFEKFPFPFTT